MTNIEVGAPAAPQAEKRTHKLWGGRFGGGPTPEFDALNNSIGVDFRLWPYDVRLSKAWAVALWGAGVLTLDESKTIERGLDAVASRLEAGEQPLPSDEDVHTLIDRLLHDEVGDVASKLHTGRSRNDQVSTAARLWTIEVCQQLDGALRGLQSVMLEQARTLETALMPSYTHLQRAIPVSAAHWLLSHFWPLERDRARLRAAHHSAAVLPLGSGAVAGCAYPISRILIQGTLGFDALSPNSIDAVSDRDFIAEVLFAATMIGTHLSRLAEDLIIYGSSEFGFVQFGRGLYVGLEHDAPEAQPRRTGARARFGRAHARQPYDPARHAQGAAVELQQGLAGRQACPVRRDLTRCSSCCPRLPARSASVASDRSECVPRSRAR
jgi:argininosuccinate lyase